MLNCKDTKKLIIEALNARAYGARIDEDGIITINLTPSLTIFKTGVALDRFVLQMLDDLHIVDLKELCRKTDSTFPYASLNVIPIATSDYDSMFWHFCNGYTGISSESKDRFANWALAVGLQFDLYTSKEVYKGLSGRELVDIMPDYGQLHTLLLNLTLAMLDLCVALECTDNRWLYEHDIDTRYLTKWVEVTSVTYDLFMYSMPSIKGLSKQCGDWSQPEVKASLRRLCNTHKRIRTTSKSAYAVRKNIEIKWPESSQLVRYISQYASIVVCMLSLTYGAVMSDDDKVCSIEAVEPILEVFGRTLHELFERVREYVEVDLAYGVTNN